MCQEYSVFHRVQRVVDPAREDPRTLLRRARTRGFLGPLLLDEVYRGEAASRRRDARDSAATDECSARSSAFRKIYFGARPRPVVCIAASRNVITG